MYPEMTNTSTAMIKDESLIAPVILKQSYFTARKVSVFLIIFSVTFYFIGIQFLPHEVTTNSIRKDAPTAAPRIKIDSSDLRLVKL